MKTIHAVALVAASLIACAGNASAQISAKVGEPLPKSYAWLDDIPLSPMLKEARALLGVAQDMSAKGDNIAIMGWEAAVKTGLYRSDEDAWCGLFVAYVASKAGYKPVAVSVRAKAWRDFGEVVELKDAVLGDILIFNRGKGGGHVGFYVAEDPNCLHVLGGNQRSPDGVDQVSIKPSARSDLIAVVRPPAARAETAFVGAKRFLSPHTCTPHSTQNG